MALLFDPGQLDGSSDAPEGEPESMQENPIAVCLRIVGAAAVCMCGGCFEDQLIEGGGSPSAETSSTAASTSGVGPGSDPSATGATAATGSDDETGTPTGGPTSSGTSTAQSGTTTEGLATRWDASCRSDAATLPCSDPIQGDTVCVAASTVPFQSVGCGDDEERRVPLSFDRKQSLVIGLLDPAGRVAPPDVRMSIVGVSPDDQPITCLPALAETLGPVAEVALQASGYDIIITTTQQAVEAPVVVRSTDTLCPVDASCCDPFGGGCADPALTECVGDLDPYCVSEAWDDACINQAVAACGAACEIAS